MTESAIIEDLELSLKILHDLREIGIQIAIDDFGTGYSSLAYIKTLPADIVKIDKSFVDSVCTDTQDQAIIKSILSLCQTLNMQTIAEGIEELAQANQLMKIGCELGQGFYFCHPLKYDKISNYLLNQRSYSTGSSK